MERPSIYRTPAPIVEWYMGKRLRTDYGSRCPYIKVICSVVKYRDPSIEWLGTLLSGLCNWDTTQHPVTG